MSALETIWKGIGNTFIKGVRRIIWISHDDAGWIELGVGQKRLYLTNTAITSAVTATSAPVGSIALTSHATGRNQIFRSDGSYWVEYLRSVSSYAGRVYLGAVAAATTSGGGTQKNLSGASFPATVASLVQPKTPRNVQLNITDGDTSITAYSVTYAGKAPDGTSITETFTQADGLTPAGSKIFQKITSITINSMTGNGSGDTLDMGYGSKLGVPLPYGAQSLVIQTLSCDGTLEAASATDTTNNSFTPTTAPNGTHVYDVAFSYAPPA